MSEFDFLAGHIALDFVNTVANRLDPSKVRDLWGAPDDLARWLVAAGLSHPLSLADGDLRRARAMRDTLHRLFVAHALNAEPDRRALVDLDRSLRALLAARRLTVVDGKVSHGWSADSAPIDGNLLPILDMAVNLLMSEQIDKIRQCAGPGCGWLFLDRSRGSSPRRWCSMQDCGNRAKANRHQARTRQQG